MTDRCNSVPEARLLEYGRIETAGQQQSTV